MSRNALILLTRMTISTKEALRLLSSGTGTGSALGEADLRNPVVQAAALLAEQVQLLQSRLLPGPVSGVLFRQDSRHESLTRVSQQPLRRFLTNQTSTLARQLHVP